MAAMAASTQRDDHVFYHAFKKLSDDEKKAHLFIIPGEPRRKNNDNFPAASVARSLRGTLRLRLYAASNSEGELIKTRGGRLIEGRYLEEALPEIFGVEEGPELA